MAELRGCRFPQDLRYDPANHLWFAAEADGVWRVGVTPFGVAIAGEILLFTSKPGGRSLAAGRAFGLLEAGKTVFPVKTPVEAALIEGNDALSRSAALMNTDAYAAWLVRLRIAPGDADKHLLCWDEARAGIAAQMDLWRFDDLRSFQAPLLGEGAKGLRG
ncbi:glycine cleavage system protein H [Thauera linaloolentis]|uniref:Glycine cleavage system H protein-like protein n=1 Tax=Thauera linaloolentis (strain DSM 12138 / JCM 21573 / CCUG 41526 / CIP 105981 / IAM 15112 / NBRC 102519 / 47Lol) TaxID=1123367 RepID=N6Y4N8_THAL4|nr:glycine cleavage system protein H [Thauera linaloolentis]ENO89151.1 Glycine cleavage system H protein - like protein [Thauera linaloolentis 47Lol = DSM 12138]MCM8567317.1 glycine cleavage system protein H [Thauera linaloolentis]